MANDVVTPLLNARTIGFLIAVNSFVVSLAIFLSARYYPQAISRSLNVFATGRMLYAIAFFLVPLRDMGIIEPSIILTNITAIIGIYLNYSATRLLIGKSPHFIGAIILGAIVGLAAFHATHIIQDLRFLRIITTLVGGGIMAAIANDLLRNCRQDGFAHILGGWVAALSTLLCLIRISTIIDSEIVPITGFPDTRSDQFFMIINFATTIMIAVTFLLISNDHFNNELRHLASTDPLTGLKTRRNLDERGNEELRRAKRQKTPFATLAMDIDHFKQINDTFGHSAGDMVLKSIAAACAGAIREVDIIGRVGGEEFVAVLVGADGNTALSTAERIRQTVETLELIAKNGAPVHVTISIGIAVLSDETLFEDVWEQADQALYQAKAEGRNRIVMAAKAS